MSITKKLAVLREHHYGLDKLPETVRVPALGERRDVRLRRLFVDALLARRRAVGRIKFVCCLRGLLRLEVLAAPALVAARYQ